MLRYYIQRAWLSSRYLPECPIPSQERLSSCDPPSLLLLHFCVLYSFIPSIFLCNRGDRTEFFFFYHLYLRYVKNSLVFDCGRGLCARQNDLICQPHQTRTLGKRVQIQHLGVDLLTRDEAAMLSRSGFVPSSFRQRKTLRAWFVHVRCVVLRADVRFTSTASLFCYTVKRSWLVVRSTQRPNDGNEGYQERDSPTAI